MAHNESAEEFSGEITDISKKFWNSGWGFATVVLDKTGDAVKVVGALEGYGVGMRISFTGCWVENPKFGMQIEVQSIVRDLPETPSGVARWLEEVLPQIGPQRAMECVRRFGVPGIWKTIETEPIKLQEIPGITAERVDDIIEAYAKFKSTRDLEIKLFNLGLERKEMPGVIREFGPEAPETLGANPYELYFRSGFTFNRTDIIGNNAGIQDGDLRRTEAAIVETIRKACYDYGHTYVLEAPLVESLCDDGWTSSQVRRSIEIAVIHEHLVRRGSAVALHKLDTAERVITSRINALLVQDRNHASQIRQGDRETTAQDEV